MNPPDVPQKIAFFSLTPFLAISFGLTWGIIALYIFLPDRMAGLFGALSGQHPLFYLAVYAPAIAAFILVVFHEGPGGLKRFLSRLLLWRCSIAWYLFLLAGIPLVFYLGAAIKGTLSYPFDAIGALLSALFFAVIKGPVEEFGWRGYALPLLQRKFAPLWASLILGLIWGVWHLPAFLLSGTEQSQWGFVPFLVGCVAISIIATGLFNGSGGSILLAALFHFQLMNPIFPDAQPYDSYILVVMAVLLVGWRRSDLLSRDGAVTEIVPRSQNLKPQEGQC